MPKIHFSSLRKKHCKSRRQNILQLPKEETKSKSECSLNAGKIKPFKNIFTSAEDINI
jgi:hypothetical protein